MEFTNFNYIFAMVNRIKYFNNFFLNRCGGISTDSTMDKISITLRKVTPELAKDILKNKNTGNYRSMKNASNLYENDMKNKRWMFNGDTIRFDWNGVLLDGQNRLKAIVESGIPQDYIFVEGLDPKCVQTIDVGYKRSPEDYIKYSINQGIDEYIGKYEKMYQAGATAVVKLSMTLCRDNKQIGHSQSNARISNTMLIDEYMSDNIHYNESARFGKEISKTSQGVLKPSHVGGIYHYLVYRKTVDKEMVKDFFEKLAAYSTTDKSFYAEGYRLLQDNKGLIGRSGKAIINAYIRIWNSKMNKQKNHILSLDKCENWFIIPNERNDKVELEIAMAE